VAAGDQTIDSAGSAVQQRLHGLELDMACVKNDLQHVQAHLATKADLAELESRMATKGEFDDVQRRQATTMDDVLEPKLRGPN